MQPPGNSVGLNNLGLTFYRGGPLCQPTYDWEMLVPEVCRALVLIPADKYTRKGSFQSKLRLNPGLVPTGLLLVWREHDKGTNRASTGMVGIRQIPAGLLPAWQERECVNRVSTGMTGYQPGFYRYGKREQREQQINRASTGVMTEFLRRRLQPGFYRCGPGLRGNLGWLPDTVSRPA